MNGDIGKLPPGAGYPATPDPLAGIGATGISYGVMNGGAAAGELMIDTGVGPLEQLPQLAMGMGGAVGYAPIDMATLSEVTMPPSQMGDHTGPNMPLDQLKQLLSSQLEYYFSRENLANDAYLLSQMDNDQYVPIWTVANFNQVKKLTKDIKLITEVLRESPNVQVDEEGQKVRPNHKRCIVILREIPDNTPIEDVKNLFSGEGCPRFISCEFAHNSSWYVTFESDEDAQKAYRFLREEVREFQGKPIMARIKAKPMNRLPIPTPVANVGGMKNGYRTPPPPPVFDPNTYQPGQQRFIYTNGTAVPQTAMTPYPNQVHVYHQPFYPTGMMPWGPTSPAFYDMTSVYTMNGIASHSSYKPHNTRYNQRNSNTYSRNKQRNGPERGAIMDGSGCNIVPMARTSHPPLSGGPVSIGVAPQAIPNILPSAKPITSYSTGTKYQSSHTVHAVAEVHSNPHVNKGSQENENHAQQDSTTQYPRHRTHRRTKDPETISKSNTSSNSNPLPSIRETTNVTNNANNNSNNTQHNRGVQFDLEAAAFPPLPGLDVNASKPHNSSSESANPEVSQSQNRLSDVVKGTAKLKSSNKEKDQQSSSAQQLQQQMPGAISSSPQYHHQLYQHQSQQHHQPHQQHNHQHSHHHHHQPHHHHQQQHHHHHQYQSSSSSSSSSSSAPVSAATVSSHSSRSTSPGSHSQQHHRRVSPEIAATTTDKKVVTSSDAAVPAPLNPNANNSADSEVVLGTVTFTPPSSPNKSNKTDVANGVDEAGLGPKAVAESLSTVVAAVPAATTAVAAAAATVSAVAVKDESVSSRCNCEKRLFSSSQNAQSHTGGVSSVGLTDSTRPSYAQVAQHSRELPCAKHKAGEKDDGST